MPHEFDGPDARYRRVKETLTAEDVHVTTDLIKNDNNLNVDAFFEACADLLAEGLVVIRDGRMDLCDRPEPSDRSVDAVVDHGDQFVEEIGFCNGDDDASYLPRLASLADLPDELRWFVQKNDFGDHVISYDRIILVGGERRAITYSAIRPFVDPSKITDDQLALVKAKGVFHALTRYDSVPTVREERLLCRFPYDSERRLLGLDYSLSRVPVIVASGSVYSSDTLVEKYVNIMRADRYIIVSQISLRPTTVGET